MPEYYRVKNFLIARVHKISFIKSLAPAEALVHSIHQAYLEIQRKLPWSTNLNTSKLPLKTKKSQEKQELRYSHNDKHNKDPFDTYIL